MNIINRKHGTICLTSVFLTMMLAGGTANAYDHNQTLGIVIGAATGGFLGSQIGDSDHYDGRRNRSHVYYDLRFRNSSHYDRGRHYGQRNKYSRYDSRRYFDRRADYPRYYHRDFSRRSYYRGGDNTTQLIATATGVFFGALIGSEIGRYMDDVDRLRARQANISAQNAPLGTQITWNNPQSYNSGSVTATRDGYSESGKYCREFYQTVTIGGKTQDAYGVACRQPDGAWQIVQPVE